MGITAVLKGHRAVMATQKQDVLRRIGQAWAEFNDVVARVPPELMVGPAVLGIWTVKDVIGHVAAWDRDAVDSLQRYLRDGDVGALGYSRYGDIDVFNERAIEAGRAKSLAEEMRSLESAHAEAVCLLWRMPDEVFACLDVGKRVWVDTFEHYPEHTEAIAVWLDGQLGDGA
jgi:hypothetical protein